MKDGDYESLKEDYVSLSQVLEHIRSYCCEDVFTRLNKAQKSQT